MKKGKQLSPFYSLAIKVVILLLLAFALYKQLFDNNQLSGVNEKLKDHIRENGSFLIVSVVVLMFCNWGLEALKWKYIINRITPIKFIRAFKAVWTGVTLGLFTPNRIGEYGGRILFIARKYRIQGVIASLIGSYAQILATLLTGVITLVLFVYHKQHLEGPAFTLITVLSAISIVILILAYYNLDIVINLFKKIKRLRRILSYVVVLDRYHNRDYTLYFALSLLRYAVYTAQYLIFLKLFGVSLSIDNGIILVGVIFFAQTIFPTFAVAELLARGNIAVYFLKYYSENDFAAIAASTCMWILNLIIPAVLGYFFIARYNFFKNKNTT